MRWGRPILLSVAVVAVIAGLIAWNPFFKDEVTKAKVSDAVLEFRKEMKRAGRFARKPFGETPAFGVYRYRTNGREFIDTGAVSTGHNYNGISTITLTPTRCGVKERWDVLVERWTEGFLCLGPKTSRVVSINELHEFFGQSRATPYECSGGDAPYASKLRPGMRWTSRCRSDDGTLISRVLVEGFERVDVGGRSYPAVEISSQTELIGDPEGSAERTSWLRRSDGLLLRRTGTSRARVETGPGGDFDERYELALVSTRPQR